MSNASDAELSAVVVLVAEDEVLIRMMVADALTDAGFAVIETGDADDALDILATRSCQVRALFTDINMPGTMNGLDLAHRVYGQWPGIALLVASGKARPAPEEMPPGSRFVSKPYHLNRLVEHIRELLDAGERRVASGG